MQRRAPLSILAGLVALGLAAPADAKVVGKTVTYKDGNEVLEGYVAYDDAATGRRPGVLVVHAWMGLESYTKKRADMLAELGYIAFAADIYGKNLRPKNPQEAGQAAGSFKKDRALLRKRANLGLEELKKQPNVDPEKTAAIGYCFGGTTVLELARSGAKVNGVASFHGGLDSQTPADAKNIKAKVLVLHGAADPYQKKEDFDAFTKELADANVDWQLHQYGGAVHCFTHFDDKGDKSKGCAYDEPADRRSWAAMKTFFDELFAAK